MADGSLLHVFYFLYDFQFHFQTGASTAVYMLRKQKTKCNSGICLVSCDAHRSERRPNKEARSFTEEMRGQTDADDV